jgi:type I restriction enzyme S subunit
MKMKFTNLGSIVDTIIDYRGKTPLKLGGSWEETPEGNYRAFSAKNIKTGKIVQYDEIRFVSPDLYKKWMKLEIKKGDILITSEAPFGQIFYWNSEEKIVLSQRLFAVRIKKEVYDKYAYYYMTSSGFQGEMKARSTGSTVEGLRQPALLRCNFAYPDYDSQKKIATLLYNYDQLIDNNNNRIQLLESLAEGLYKEWFVRFRFPGFEKMDRKDSELGKIPSNFDVLKANEVFDYYIGGGWGNNEFSDGFPVDAYVIRGADFPLVNKSDISTCPYRYHKTSNYKPRKLKENDIVFEISGGTAEQPVGRAVLVTKGILEQLDNKAICASFCKLIRPNYTKVKPNYFYQWLKFLYDTRMIERFQLQSTGIINFKFEYFLRKGPVMVPPIELIEKYENYVKPMREEIDKLAIKNKLLIQQRDSLLPRLMSGKLSVEGKEVI